MKTLLLVTLLSFSMISQNAWSESKHDVNYFNQINPSNWIGKYISHDGTIWSETLKSKYVNCISYKNEDGSYQYDENNDIACKKQDGLLNAVNDFGDEYFKAGTKTIEKSDATEACRAIGGKLPTLEQFNSLRNSLPNSKGMIYWTSTIGNFGDQFAYKYFSGYGTNNNHNRVIPMNVRCVDHN